MNGSDVLIETLEEWGVKVIFGFPGDGINGIMESLRVRQERIRFVQVRHEESAAFMACSYAKFTGKLGVCLATSGPGGIHLLNGLYDAKLDSQPVLAITGLQAHDLIDTFTQQDVDLNRVFEDVAVYNVRIMGAAHVRALANVACRSALARRGVAHLSFPVDLQSEDLPDDARSRRNVKGHSASALVPERPRPSPADLKRAAEILNGGSKTTILVGQGALGAGAQLERLAQQLGAPIVKALLGKAAVPDDSPYTTGGVGLLGTAPSAEVLKECDTLLIVGSSFPYIEFYPRPGEARAVQIDLDPVRIGLRYPVEIGLVGDSATVLDALLPLLKIKTDHSFLTKAQQRMEKWRSLMVERGTRSDMPMKPQVVARTLGSLLQPNAIVVTDSGTVTTWAAREISIRRDQMFSCSGNLATMACGLPYAIAAQIAHPGRQVVALVGDGALAMLMAELATAVKYDLPVKIVVIKNNSLGQIKWEQISFLGNPEFAVDLQPIDFAGVARACGAKAFHLDNPKDCESVLREALGHNGPALVEAVVDPLEPPMPGHITMEQAGKFAKALLRGESERGKIMKTLLVDKIHEVT
jgi:pyruvate dehydrogenase (quinone)/pyruvate oxidase